MAIDSNNYFSHTLHELSRLISRPESDNHIEEKYGMDCNHRLYCLASVPVSILKGVTDEAKDLLAIIEKTVRFVKYLIKGLADEASPKSMEFDEEYKERRWRKCTDAGIKAVDCLAASVIRPLAVVSDAIKFTLGVIEPSAAIRPFSWDEDVAEF